MAGSGLDLSVGATPMRGGLVLVVSTRGCNVVFCGSGLTGIILLPSLVVACAAVAGRLTVAFLNSIDSLLPIRFSVLGCLVLSIPQSGQALGVTVVQSFFQFFDPGSSAIVFGSSRRLLCSC